MRWIILLLFLVSCEPEYIYLDPQPEHFGFAEITNEYVPGTFMITTGGDWRFWDTVVYPMWFNLHETKTFELAERDYRIQLQQDNYYYSAKILVFRDSTVYRTISTFSK